jgi:hypothetical protein
VSEREPGALADAIERIVEVESLEKDRLPRC